MSVFEENDEKNMRIAYLAIVGSHSANGVAEQHFQLLQENLFSGVLALKCEAKIVSRELHSG